MIYLGCSGWGYPDWVVPFYPKKSTHKLDHYSSIFNTVEINTTFYRVPDIRVVTGWLKRVSGKNFRFSVKFPGEVTHRNLMSDQDQAVRMARKFEEHYLLPMLEEGKLAAVLIQLPPYFTIENSGSLIKLLKGLSTSKVRYFVEPRHSTLYTNEEFHGEVADTGAEIVDIDGPEKIFDRVSSRSSSFYLRFHGRNYSTWGVKTDNPSDRYDYEYTQMELRTVADIIAGSLKRFKDAFIYFNNHPGGKAPRNALSLAGMLGQGSSDPQKRLY